MTTHSEALTQVYGKVKAAVEAQAAAAIGYVPTIEYEGVEADKHAKKTDVWLRCSTRGVVGRQMTLGTPEPGKHEYESVNMLFVQVFGPKKDGAAITKIRKIAQIAQNAYRSVAAGGEVWFRDATIREQPPEADWYQINVTVEYNYVETV